MSRSLSLEAFSAILAAIDAAASNPARLKDLLSTLIANAGDLFRGAALLKGGYARGPFVVVSTQGCDAHAAYAARTWMRWPLRRLFVHMKPARIFSPENGSLALAIPFSHAAERWVVIAPIADALTADEEQLFEALECITIPERELFTPEHAIPILPLELSIAGFALCQGVRERLAAPLGRRGWSVDIAATPLDLLSMLQGRVPDIVAVDVQHVADPITTLTSIHRIANTTELRILAFHAGERFACDLLPMVDRVLSHDADSDVIFGAVKELSRESAALHHKRSHETLREVERRAAAALTLQELAEFTASRAAEVLCGWAGCFLVNEYGAVYESQSPPVRRTLLRTLPKSLLNDVATFEVSVGEKFLAEITDDASDRIALLGLQPLSGASIPIVSPDGLRRGVLIACSTERPADSSMFERLNGLTRVVGVRFAELQPNWRTVPEFRQDRFWERLRDRALGLDVYRSAGCDIPWRYRMLGEASGLLTLGFQDDGELCERLIGARCASELGRNLADQLPRGPCFASTIDFSLQSMNYAARYFSPPVILSPMGPTATIGSWGAMVAGTAKLPAGASAFICDRGLSSWLQHKNPTIASLPALLDSENPAGLASIVTLGCPPL